MKLIINIPDNLYNFVNTKRPNGYYNEFDKFDTYDVSKAIRNGTPLPKGHGRLIDADALIKKMCGREEELGDDRAMWESSAVSVALDMFAPTIIEADKGE